MHNNMHMYMCMYMHMCMYMSIRGVYFIQASGAGGRRRSTSSPRS